MIHNDSKRKFIGLGTILTLFIPYTYCLTLKITHFYDVPILVYFSKSLKKINRLKKSFSSLPNPSIHFTTIKSPLFPMM